MHVGVVIEETWAFFREIFEELNRRHQTTLFKRHNVVLPVFQTRVNDYLFYRDLERLLRSNDVVFFEWASELLVHASRLPKTCGIVTRLHRYELYHWADQVNWEAVDRIILVSQAKKMEFAQRFSDQTEKIVIIPEAISLSEYRPHNKPFGGDIGILCHLTPRKRVYELILAFNELIRKQEGFTLHIGGGRHPRFGDYYEALHHLVGKLGIDEQVIFYGNVTDTQEWYSKIDIFISNSYSEGLQVSPMEAIVSGCFCLSHAWDGAEELLPESYLYITEQDLITKILKYSLASSDTKLAEREEQRRIIRERFDIDRVKGLVCQAIEEVGMAHVRSGRG